MASGSLSWWLAPVEADWTVPFVTLAAVLRGDRVRFRFVSALDIHASDVVFDDHLPVIPPGPPPAIQHRQQRCYPLPRRIRQLTTPSHRINDQLWLVTHEPQEAARRCRTGFKKLSQVEQSCPLLLVVTPLHQGGSLLAGNLCLLLVEQ